MDENVPIHVKMPTNRGQNIGYRPNGPDRHPKTKGRRLIFAAKIVGIIVLVGMFLSASWLLYGSRTGANIDGGKYQSVFLANGQVYFGKLQTLNGDYLKLTDIYYLETKTATSSDNPQETSSQTASDVQLIKLGSEIHGPDDEMIINKDQILFFENLKNDSTVSKTIAKYQKQ